MLKVGNVWVCTGEGVERDILYRALQYEKKDYKRNYRTGRWDVRAYELSVMDSSGRFPSGLLDLAVRRLKAEGITPEVDDLRVRPCPHLTFAPAKLVGTTLMDHQEVAVEAAYVAGRGVIHHPTSAGKTISMIELTRRCAVPALVLTHRKELLRQLYQEYTTRLNIPGLVGIIGGGRWQPGPAVTISTFQSLYSAMKDGEGPAGNFFDTIQAVFVDEVHHVSADTFGRVMAALKNAYYRYGVSATPDRGGEHETWLKVTGWTGPVVSHVTPTEGVEVKRLVPADVFFVDYGGVPNNGQWPSEYDNTIVLNGRRNELIAEIATLAPKPCLVLIQRIEHGERLAQRITASSPKTAFVSGDSPDHDREQALKDLGTGTIETLVSSVILDEGVDVPAIRSLILAGGGKAPHLLTQRVGRGMRSAEGKERLLVFDMIDRGKYTGKHARMRYDQCRAEKAYTVFQMTADEVREALKEA